MRPLFLSILLAITTMVSAQRMDSIHVFRRIPAGAYTSASANALAWRLHKTHAPHRSIKSHELVPVREAIARYTPQRHTHGALPHLSHVAMVFSGGRPVAFGVTEGLDRVIDFTARTEYRIDTWAEHLTVRVRACSFRKGRSAGHFVQIEAHQVVHWFFELPCIHSFIQRAAQPDPSLVLTATKYSPQARVEASTVI